MKNNQNYSSIRASVVHKGTLNIDININVSKTKNNNFTASNKFLVHNRFPNLFSNEMKEEHEVIVALSRVPDFLIENFNPKFPFFIWEKGFFPEIPNTLIAEFPPPICMIVFQEKSRNIKNKSMKIFTNIIDS